MNLSRDSIIFLAPHASQSRFKTTAEFASTQPYVGCHTKSIFMDYGFMDGYLYKSMQFGRFKRNVGN
jgi:hypothetical protein